MPRLAFQGYPLLFYYFLKELASKGVLPLRNAFGEEALPSFPELGNEESKDSVAPRKVPYLPTSGKRFAPSLIRRNLYVPKLIRKKLRGSSHFQSSMLTHPRRLLSENLSKESNVGESYILPKRELNESSARRNQEGGRAVRAA